MNSNEMAGNSTPSKGRLLSGFQIRVLILCALAGLLDGNDTGIISIAIPGLAAKFHIAASALGWAVSGSFLGAALGALLFGSLADKFGRKRTLIIALLAFGTFTILTPFAQSLSQLVALRVLAGIGLGGAAPCVIALTSEYSPARIRGTVTSLVWASFPLGLLLGGLFSGGILTRYSWEMVFYIGGVAPVVLAVVMLLFLPESPAFLLAQNRDSARAKLILAKIGHDLRDDLPIAAKNADAVGSRAGLGAVLREGGLAVTLCIWVILFTCYGTSAVLIWVPTILHQHGASLSAAAFASSLLGVGVLLGMVIAGWLVDRFGAIRALIGPLLIGVIATAAMGYWVTSPIGASFFVGLVGACVGIGASGAIALTTLIYSSSIRSNAAGWAMGMGRFGQVILPGIFAVLLGAKWSVETIFLLLAVCPLIAVAAVVVLGKARRATGTESQVTGPVRDPHAV